MEFIGTLHSKCEAFREGGLKPTRGANDVRVIRTKSLVRIIVLFVFSCNNSEMRISVGVGLMVHSLSV